ncbi:uncharacterized protein [Primulina huaijiensis]|uniref:uncharacterized protein n=1 Tax=Primulina huaijiensis TaxID=1492673 RepID=UPI003CC76657
MPYKPAYLRHLLATIWKPTMTVDREAKQSKRGTMKHGSNTERVTRHYELISRCSPSFFQSTVQKLKPKIGLRQMLGLKKTPFFHLFEMPKFHVSFARVESILRRYDLISDAFVFGDKIDIPFISSEFSVVMRLKDIGQHIDLDMSMESDIVRRHFQGKTSIVKRKNIAAKLDMLADKQEDIDVDDFVKLYIIFVFNCILFPTSNCTTPRFLLPYVDDLSKICNYAWGNAAYRFLNEEILKHVRDGERRKKYFDGCVIGLMAWVYERIPSLGKPCALHIFPRFFRWVDSKIPNDLDAASVAFLSITKNKVLPHLPFT